MDSDDGCNTASTDTSMFLRELQNLNASNLTGTSPGSGPLEANQSATSDTLTDFYTGEDGSPETLSCGMRTVRQPPQTVKFCDDTEDDSVAIHGNAVDVYVSPTGNLQEKAPGSNKVKVTPLVNHMWEHKYHHGNLVAVHKDLDFLAYVLKGKTGGNCRVVSRKTAIRSLLRCFNGNVLDIAFALSDDAYLAAVDETGTLFVHSFVMDGTSILSQLIMHVEMQTFNIESVFRNQARVIWCPYVPDDESDVSSVDVAKMLVLLHGTQAQVWNVDYVYRDQGSRPDPIKSIGRGMMSIEPYEPLMPVVNAAFAPDGSALAVAYYSGLVKFFLVDLDGEDDTNCMHEWNPHDGKPVTSLFFLDNHRYTGSAEQQLWKFALTGADYNTELKIWSCESWICVQTIRFHSPISQPNFNLQLKTEIDLTSKYFVLSDIHSRVLYILQLHQDFKLGTAHSSSISKFCLAQPCISFAVYDASVKRMKRSMDDSHLDEITTGELEEDEDDEVMKENGDTQGTGGNGISTMGVQVRMYGIHTKCVQELSIRYRPESTVPPPLLIPMAPSSLSNNEEAAIHDMLSDVSLDQSQSTAFGDLSNIPHDPHVSLSAPGQPTSSPHKSALPTTPSLSPQSDTATIKECVDSVAGELRSDSPVDPANLPSVASSTSSFTHVTAMIEEAMDSPLSSVDPSVMSPTSAFSQSPQKPSANQSSNALPTISSCDDDDADDEGDQNQIPVHESLDSDTRHSNQDLLDDMFTGSSWQNKLPDVPGDSMESTVSSDVARKQPDRYDEDDQEVAQALSSTLVSEGFGGPQQGEIDNEEEELEVNRSLEEKKKEAKWPDPPDVSTEAKRLVSEAIKQSSPPVVVQAMVSDKAFENVESKLSDLADKMLKQQEMLIVMQKEMASQREVQIQLHRQQLEQQQLQQVASQQPSIQEDISKLEDILVSRMEHSLAQHMHKETQRLQDSLAKTDQQRAYRDKALQSSLINEMGPSIRDSLAHTLKAEMKQTVTPALHRFVEPMKDKIHQEVAQRLTACDSLLRDNIAKAVKSRSTMDVLANSVGDVIYQQMQHAYSHTFKTSFLPSLTASMEKTVQDVHAVFQQGTKEYQHYLKQNSDFVVRERTKTEEIIQRMEAAEKQFAQGMTHMKNLILTSVKDELSGQVAQAVASLRADMVSDIRRAVKEEVGLAMKDHGASIDDKLTTYLRSAAATPVPGAHNDDMAVVSKEKIIRDLRGGHIDEAFQSALSAENLDLVLYACEAVSPMNLFSMSPCPLSQPVLLSLISQLATNLDQNFEIKMRFLSDAVMSLDPDNSRTAEHIPPVLGALVRCLNTAHKAFSSEPRKVKEIKMLIMAANSLVASRM